jgi:hypothetical protein
MATIDEQMAQAREIVERHKKQWHIGMRNGHNSNIIYAYDGADEFDDSAICTVHGMYMHCKLHDQDNAEFLARAHLISAAPELLAALLIALGEIAPGKDAAGNYPKWVDKACDAIRKARGEA